MTLPSIPGYRLDEVLHHSQRTVVYRGARLADALPVLIKAPGSEQPSLRQLARLRNEADMLRMVSGAGLIELLEEVRCGPNPALVLKDTGGLSLRQKVGTERLSVADFLDLAVRIADALQSVHACRITHRDVNPANIVVRPDGAIQLIDFGLATTLVEETPDPSEVWLEGTLPYLSPEQTGRTNRAVDYRTDFYALGATFYQLLTGAPPFPSDDPLEILHGHLARRPTPPHEVVPQIGPALSSVLMKLLAKAPEDRYQSAAGLIDDLGRCRGTSEPFPLGSTDHASHLALGVRLYAREAELRTLEAAFTAATQGQFNLVLIRGPAGVGKTSLVRELFAPVARARGQFASGKCDELHRDVPYFALTQALRGVVQQLLASSPVQLARWREAILQAVGQHGALVVDAVPELHAIIGPQPALSVLPPAESRNRHDRIMYQFVRSLAVDGHPLAIYLDDLQWADLSTLRLLEALSTEARSVCLLLVAAWRDDEVGPQDALQTTLNRLRPSASRITEVALTDLGDAPVAQLLADALGRPLSEVVSLAEILVEKTRGNPFFVRQFLASMEAEGLLSFDRAARGWTWEVERVRAADITPNVADLMGRRIGGLPANTQQILQTAACVGARFDAGVLAAARACPPLEVARALRPALEAGLVLPVGQGLRHLLAARNPQEAAEAADDATFRFLHDRVRQAAAAMLADDLQVPVHLAIGRHMRSRLGTADDDRIFEVVQHLNRSHALLDRQSDRDDLAMLNVAAGQRATRSAAFATALGCFDMATSLLGDEGWTRLHEMTVTAHLDGATAACMSGLPGQTRTLLDQVLAKGSLLERCRALDVQMLDQLLRSRDEQALETGLEALSMLGERLPAHPTRASVAVQVGRTALMLAGTAVEALASRPEGHDPQHRMIMRLLSRACIPAFLCRMDLAAYMGLRLVQRSLRYGMTSESSRGFTTFGVTQAALLGNVQLGERYGQVALQLAARFPAGADLIGTRYGVLHLIQPWCSPFRPIVEQTMDLYRLAVDRGDYDIAQHLAWAYIRLSYLAGTSLPHLAAEVARMKQAVESLRQGPAPLHWHVQEMVLDRLMGRTESTVRLTGVDHLQDGNKVVAWTVAGEQAWFLFLFGTPDEALEYVEVLARLVDSMLGLPEVPWFHYLASLIRLRVAEPARWRRAVEDSRSRLRRWGRQSPANYAHCYHLVDAEWQRVNGGDPAAAYDQAARTARESGLTAGEALALELAGEWYLQTGRARVARVYLSDAMYAWERWGASARVRHLRRRHADLLETPRSSTSVDSTAGSFESSGAGHLDLMTVLKATQAISGEIVRDRLLQRLLAITLEGAGAQRAVLIVERDGRLTVEAVGEVLQDGVQVTVATRALEHATDLAVSVVQYVSRTQQAVVLQEDVSDTFGADPYLQTARPLSVMAVPVVAQGRQTGILYVENNLTRQAFTANRQQLLRTLGAQAAVSLENARLYTELDEHRQTLEARVNERTEALRAQNERLQQAQAQIVAQQKLAYLGTLTAGIAHEIRNPLNFVTNFAAMSEDVVAELRDQSELPAEVRTSLETLELHNRKIREHAGRADAVVQSMLLHAGASTGEREPTDLNALVKQSADLARHGHFEASPLELKVCPDADLPLLSTAPRDLARAFLNILGNAIHASFAKARRLQNGFTPHVTATLSHTATTAVVRVRDNGDGIAPDILDQLFLPFFTTRPTGQGTGLGLSIAHDIIVGQHGGRLLVDSVPGEFAEFTVELNL